MTKHSKTTPSNPQEPTTTEEVIQPEQATDAQSIQSPDAPVQQQEPSQTETEAAVTAEIDHPESGSEPEQHNADTPASDNIKQHRQPSSTGLIAALALLLALASTGFSGWLWFQLDDTSHSQVTSDNTLQELTRQLDSQDRRLHTIQQHVTQLPSADVLNDNQRTLNSMQAAHQAFTQRFEQAFGNTRQDWRLAEAEHLLRMAILRLTALQDLNSAKHLIEATDQILFEQDDPAAYASREAIAKALADLHAMPKLDRAGIFMRLGALQQQVRHLDQLMPGFTASTPDNLSTGSTWKDWLNKLSSYIRIDFNSTDEVQPLLSSQEITHIRLAVSLSLEQAQWAALNGQQAVYERALEQGLDILKHYFTSDNQTAQRLAAQLQELAEQPISQAMPDIKPALLALQAYMQERALEYRTRSEVQP